MPSPNVNTHPQPNNVVILRGAIQIETVLTGLEAAGLNTELQEELSASLQEARSMATTADASDLGLNYTWFKTGSGAKRARKDVLEGLNHLAERKTAEENNSELAFAAEALRTLLEAK